MIDNNILDEKINSLVYTIGNNLMNYIKDLEISNLMLNSDSKLWIKKAGQKIHVDNISNKHATNILQKIADLNNTVINSKNARLATQITLPINSREHRKIRVQGFVPPVTNNASFILRLHSNILYSLDDYIANNNLILEQKNIIDKAILNKDNIIIAGAGDSGKTTIANAILLRIAQLTPDDRCLILQDTQELKSSLPDTEYLTSNTQVSLNDLIMDTLRSTADRIIIGEIRSGIVALELLKMCNTGHRGSLATIHADSAKDTINRFSELMLEVSQNNMLNLINSNIDLVIYMQDRKVIDVLEV